MKGLYSILLLARRVTQDDIVEEESGWKLIHGDVFRFPPHINLFSALMGSGTQVMYFHAYQES